jgi:hypothetical protein
VCVVVVVVAGGGGMSISPGLQCCQACCKRKDRGTS